MSKAEELLYSIGQDDASEENDHIVINADRTIIVPDNLKSIAVQFDNNIETVTFDCPRYWDGHDFYSMDVYINYMRSDGHKGSYTAKNVVVDENDNTMIHFDWTITEDVTMVSGTISFLVCIKNTAADTKPHWNSHLCRDLKIENGMEVYDHIVENSPDIIEEILARLDMFQNERTHWIEILKEYEILPETKLTSTEPGNFVIDSIPIEFVVDETYIVKWNGVEYTSTAIDATAFVGEPAVMLLNDGANIETSAGMIFVITHIVGSNTIELRAAKSTTTLDVSIYKANKIIHKLPEEFIPDSIATKNYVHTFVIEQLGVIENGYY